MRSSKVILKGHYIFLIAPPYLPEVKNRVLADRYDRQLLVQIAFFKIVAMVIFRALKNNIHIMVCVF